MQKHSKLHKKNSNLVFICVLVNGNYRHSLQQKQNFTFIVIKNNTSLAIRKKKNLYYQMANNCVENKALKKLRKHKLILL